MCQEAIKTPSQNSCSSWQDVRSLGVGMLTRGGPEGQLHHGIRVGEGRSGKGAKECWWSGDRMGKCPP